MWPLLSQLAQLAEQQTMVVWHPVKEKNGCRWVARAIIPRKVVSWEHPVLLTCVSGFLRWCSDMHVQPCNELMFWRLPWPGHVHMALYFNSGEAARLTGTANSVLQISCPSLGYWLPADRWQPSVLSVPAISLWVLWMCSKPSFPPDFSFYCSLTCMGWHKYPPFRDIYTGMLSIPASLFFLVAPCSFLVQFWVPHCTFPFVLACLPLPPNSPILK